MSLLRLILLGILFYWGFKLLGSVLRMMSGPGKKVEGQPKGKEPLDLSQHDVEDADFEEID